MTVVLIILGCLVGLLILKGLIGWVLPKGHVATVNTRLKRKGAKPGLG